MSSPNAHNSERNSDVGLPNTGSGFYGFKSTSNNPSHSGNLLLNPPSTNTPQTYANRAATAIKVSSAFARINKAIYGSSAASPTPSTTPGSSPGETPFPGSEVNISGNGDHNLSYTARSDIVVMGLSSDKESVAIAGKDCR